MIITLWANRQFSPFPVVRNNCYFIADEVRAIPNGIFYLFEIGLLRFFVIVCFKTAFARAEMKRWDEMVSLCSIYFSLSYKTKSWISRGFYCMRLSFFWNSVNFPSNKVYVFCTAQRHGLLHCIIAFCILFLKIILVNRNIREDDLFKICIYLRSYGIFDQADQERIFNDLVFCTPERKASELLTEIGKRGHHVYWHLAHALKTRQTPMFNFFHGGDFQCCGMYVQWFGSVIDKLVKKTRVGRRVAHWSQALLQCSLHHTSQAKSKSS